MPNGLERFYNSFVLRDFSYVIAGTTAILIWMIDKYSFPKAYCIVSNSMDKAGFPLLLLLFTVAYIVGILLSEILVVLFYWVLPLLGMERSDIDNPVIHIQYMDRIQNSETKLRIERLTYLKTITGAMAMSLFSGWHILSPVGYLSSYWLILIFFAQLICFGDFIRLRAKEFEAKKALAESDEVGFE